MGAEFGAAETGISLVRLMAARLIVEEADLAKCKPGTDAYAIASYRVETLKQELDEAASRNRMRLKVLPGGKS